MMTQASREANVRIEPYRMTDAMKILDIIKTYPRITYTDIATLAGMKIPTVTGRLTELKQSKAIFAHKYKGETKSRFTATGLPHKRIKTRSSAEQSRVETLLELRKVVAESNMLDFKKQVMEYIDQKLNNGSVSV